MGTLELVTWEDELARCPLAAGPFRPDARRCDWCGKTLAGRRRRWCSDACSYAYSENHAWSSARAAALRRDKVCQRCGSDGRTVAEAWYRVLLVICPRPTPPRLLDFCRTHGWYPDHVEARDAYRAHVARQQAPWLHASAVLDEHRRRHRLEVNHKTPCLGAHRENSCAHHLDGEVARGLSLRCEVVDGAPEHIEILSEKSDATVAPVAEQPADEAGLMVVVYVRDDLSEAAFADGTRVPLSLEHRDEVLDVEPVVPAEVPGLARAPERTEPGVGSSLRGSTAERADDRVLAAPAPMPERASPRAIEALLAGEHLAALGARSAPWRSVVGAGATPAVVVPFANLATPSRSWAGASGDLTGHAAILAVVNVPSGGMPASRGGLEVLCHPCHLRVTARQRAAGLLHAG